MKLFKKFASFILAFAMVMAIAMPSVVKAEGNGSITITGAKSGHIFEAYQIFAGDLSEDGKSLSNITWGSGVTEAGKTEFGNAQDKARSLESNRPAAVTFANAVSKYLNTASGTRGVVEGENYKINNLTPGYYLVKDQDDSVSGQDSYTKFILEVVGNDISAKVKSSVPTSEKKVKDTNDFTGKTTGWQDSADYDIGDEVPFQLTGHVATDYNEYNSAYQLVFHDTLSNGLTFNASSVKVYVNDNTDPVTADMYTITNPTTDGHSFDVTIHDVKALGQDISKVRVEYTAKLNDNAAIGSAGNPNTMYMEFSNNPNSTQGGSKGQTPEDKVIVFTYKTVINKINSSHQPLTGAAFKLEKVLENGSTELVKEYKITDVDRDRTSFEFTGLDDGKYILTETETPDGYNTMHPITFSIVASHDTASANPTLTELNGDKVSGEIEFATNINEGTLTANVVNYKGSELPNTGGMGTTILYAAGVILILAAGAFLLMQKKAENK